MKKLAIFLIKVYQRTISVDHGPLRALFPGDGPVMCRYHPTCSEYAMEAIMRHGFFHGVLLGSQRILRCHPWSHHPIHDPVR